INYMYGVGMTRGLQSPSSTIQRAWHRIGNRIRRAIQPVSNAYEDAAQTTGGRNTHGDKSGRGETPQGPAARDARHPRPSRSVSNLHQPARHNHACPTLDKLSPRVTQCTNM